MKCKTAVDDNKAVCKNCEPFLKDLYYEKVKNLRNLEFEYNKLWTQCQRCVKSFYQEIACENSECPIFYQRQRSKLDLNQLKKEMKKFEF